MLDQPVPNPLAKNPNVHTHKVFASVGLVLIGTIIAVAGIWWYVQNQSGDNTVEDSTTTTKVSTSSANKATESATKDETADWKTYTNNQGFSIKYPIDLEPVLDDPVGDGQVPSPENYGTLLFIDKNLAADYTPTTYFSASTNFNSKFLFLSIISSSNQYYTQGFSTTVNQNYDDNKRFTSDISALTETSVAGKKSYTYTMSSASGFNGGGRGFTIDPSLDSIRSVTIDAGKYFLVIMYQPDQTLEKMVSTIKFL